MLTVGLIREGKIPQDNRVAFTPAQCRFLTGNSQINIIVQPSAIRCFKDEEYLKAGITVSDDLSPCDVLFGIKEVPVSQLLEDKTYLFFSHTKKMQPHNREMFRSMVDKKITLIDYECMEHEDGQRIIGFGFFAGIVGAHNGIMAYGNRTGLFKLDRVYKQKDYRTLINSYFGLSLPEIKIAVTGSGRVAHGIIEIMNLMDVQEVEQEEYLNRSFRYPVFVHLKGKDLYRHRQTGGYNREHFHQHAEEYICLFPPYCNTTDILINGVYWDTHIPKLFEWEQLQHPSFRVQTIADVSDDKDGSIPCNLGDATIENPVYGVDIIKKNRMEPYKPDGIDIMAVGNLPNELPKDASRFFGEQIIKHILPGLLNEQNSIIQRATILDKGELTPLYQYMQEYAG